MTPLQVLQETFGFAEFRTGQKEVIEALLAGQSAAAVFPTGAGKSLCFQLPAIMLSGLTLVVSPLMALMKDQVDALTERGVRAARLDSSLSAEEYKEVLKQARAGELKLLYVAPERFNNESFRRSLSGFHVSLMAIDEAHCVSEWGHNFRPDYLKLNRYAKDCRAERVLALTATATPQVLRDIQASFDISVAVRTPFHRPNLHLRVTSVGRESEKLRLLMSHLESLPGPSIVYVTLQKTAQQIADALVDQGFEARPYHAGLTNEVRQETQEWFFRAERGVVVATIAFGMGIDKADIRGVFHYDPPKSLENYSQEIGRAGRDGKTSLCHFTYYAPDRIPLENFVYGDTPTQEAIHSFLGALFAGPQELLLNLHQWSVDHDLKLLVLRTLLTYLEIDGYVQAGTPVYASYKFKPAAASREILAAYEPPFRGFLASVLKHSVKKRVWFEIDLETTALQVGTGRQEVGAALDRLAEDGWMEVQASDLRYRYQILRAPESLEALSRALSVRAEQREEAEIARLGQVLSIPRLASCLAAFVAGHFGEQLEAPCGHCTVCMNGPLDEQPEPPEEDFELGPVPEELPSKREKARFLCGLSSPQLSKSKLSRRPDFGRLSHVSFQRVLDRLP